MLLEENRKVARVARQGEALVAGEVLRGIHLDSESAERSADVAVGTDVP